MRTTQKTGAKLSGPVHINDVHLSIRNEQFREIQFKGAKFFLKI